MTTKIEFTTRYPNLDNEASGFAELEQVADDMIALAHAIGVEAFHFVNGAVFMMRRIGGVGSDFVRAGIESTDGARAGERIGRPRGHHDGLRIRVADRGARGLDPPVARHGRDELRIGARVRRTRRRFNVRGSQR